jgi:hypothetical protein
MALHRDIHWIGRQWAVTGHGMQLIDQKLKGFFDIEASHLWEDALIESMRAKEWLNVMDFDKGLSVARARFPQSGVTRLAEQPIAPARSAAPLPRSPQQVAKPAAPRPAEPEPAKPAKLDPIKPPLAASVALRASATTRAETRLPEPVAAKFQIRFSAHAKFIRPWRVLNRQ